MVINYDNGGRAGGGDFVSENSKMTGGCPLLGILYFRLYLMNL